MSAKTDATTAAAIVAAYNELHSYDKVAAQFGMSKAGVRTVYLRTINSEDGRKIEAADRKSADDIIAFLESRSDKACRIIDTYMDALLDPDRLDRATPNQVSTALGTVIDKFLLAKSLLKEKGEAAGGVIVLPEVKKDE